jgi:hypothetical protein
MRRWPIIASIVLVVCSSASMGPVSVPMSYKTMASPAEFPSVQSCAAVSRIDVRDNRSDQTLGKRYQQESTATTYPVTTTSDVAEWIRSGATAAVQKANVNVSGHGPTVQLRVDQITVSESVYRRAEYNGRVALTADVMSGSRSCWNGRVDGSSQNYGYAGSAENYQETLNHALDRAMISLLNNSDFTNALCNCR